MNNSNVSGKLDQVAGKIKQGVGEAVGSEKLANEGAAQQVKGQAKEAWGNVKDTANDLSDHAKAHATVREEEAKLDAHEAGTTTRDKITDAAANAKDSINRGLDHLKDKDRHTHS